MYSTGNVTALGNWNTGSAISLGASRYTNSNPLWSGAVNLAPGTGIQYKFIRVSSSGIVTWEVDPDRILSVPCAAATVSSTWQG